MGGVTEYESEQVETETRLRPSDRSDRSDRLPLEDKLATFDYQRWSVACREMQVRILNGHVGSAHDVLDAFVRFQRYETATINSPVGAVLPVRLAGMLETAGYMKLSAVDRVSDSHILAACRGIGEQSLAQIRQTIAQVKRGEVLEQYEEDAQLLDEASFIRRLPAHCNCNPREPHMQSPSKPDQVLAALYLVADSPATAAEVLDQEIEKREAELKRLREMRRLVTAGSKPKPPRRRNNTERLLELERKIFDLVNKSGPTSANQLAELLGTYPKIIREAVASSDRLIRENGEIRIG